MPRRRCTGFLLDPDFEFEFYLAEQLKMTVADLRDRIGQREFLEWQVYYGRQAQKQELEQLKAKRGR